MSGIDTSILNSVADIDAGRVAEEMEKLKMMAEPINGPNSFNLETAAYGYITREERLVIPAAYENKIPLRLGDAVNLNVVQLMGIAMYNYLRMRQRNQTEEHSMFIALYRARLIKLGYLLRTKEARHVTVDEVDYLKSAKDHYGLAYNNVTDFAAAIDAETTDEGKLTVMFQKSGDATFKKFLSLVAKHKDILKYVTLVATQLAASTYLVFRQNGHHYKSDLGRKYDILWKATTLDTYNFVPGNEEIHRVAIHSFGVYVLHEKFFENMEAGLLAETYMERSNVTPCGVAIINTCWASIKLMQSLPIWEGLYRAYKFQIDELQAQAALLQDAKEAIKYHKNAKLFGQTRIKLDATAAYALAPVAKGFLMTMPDDTDIKRQKTLDKRANQNPVTVQLITSVIIGVMERIQQIADLARALPSTKVPESRRVEEAEVSG